MKAASMIASLLVAASAVHGHAQRPLGENEVVAQYTAILMDLQDYYSNRAIVVDPRISAVSFRNATALDVWEHRLPDAAMSAAVQGLRRTVEGVTYCVETSNRANCLNSTKHVHVMFAAPAVEGSTTTVEVTVAFRIRESSSAYAIQTWRYTFLLWPQGPSLARRESLAEGHGQIGVRK